MNLQTFFVYNSISENRIFQLESLLETLQNSNVVLEEKLFEKSTIIFEINEKVKQILNNYVNNDLFPNITIVNSNIEVS